MEPQIHKLRPLSSLTYGTGIGPVYRDLEADYHDTGEAGRLIAHSSHASWTLDLKTRVSGWEHAELARTCSLARVREESPRNDTLVTNHLRHRFEKTNNQFFAKERYNRKYLLQRVFFTFI